MKKSFLKYAVLLFSIIFIISNYTCKKATTEPTPDGTKVIATDGAILTSPDGLLTLTIPGGALQKDTYIDIEVINKDDYPDDLDSMFIVGEVYDLQPDGLELNIPAIVDIEMSEDEVTSIVEDGEYPFISGFSLTSDGVYSLIDSSTVIYNISDGTAKYSGQIEHFSYYLKTRRIFDYEVADASPRNLGEILIDVNIGPAESLLNIPHQVTALCQNLTNVYIVFNFSNHEGVSPVHWEISEGNGEMAIPDDIVSYTHPSDWVCQDIGESMIFIEGSARWANPTPDRLDGHYFYQYLTMIFEHEIECIANDDGGDEDSDGDGILDGDDNCPWIPNADQADVDGDGIGDVCDNCPTVANADQADGDSDGKGDVCDICEGHDDKEDDDGDGVPNGCDICEGHDDKEDDDGDGVPNGCDICEGHDDKEDDDGDGVPNGCDICEGHDDKLDDDVDGVPNGCDLCEGYDDKEDDDVDGVPNGCDNCPVDGNPDQADADNDGIGDACEGATNCGDDNLIEFLQPYEHFFGFEPCSAVQPRIPYDYIPNCKTSGVPLFYTANDQTTTLYSGGLPQVIDHTLWGPGDPAALPFNNGPPAAIGVHEWDNDNKQYTQKLLSTKNPQDEENWVIFFNVMEQDIPPADPTNHYQYGFVFDRDGDPSNNYQPHPDYANDFFKDTDFWVVAYYDPTNGWMLMVVDVNVGDITDTSAAKMLISGNTIIVFIPRSEFSAQNIGYRITAFRHDGSWADDANAGADTQPSVNDDLRLIDIGPE